jgi:hypothetical protein
MRSGSEENGDRELPFDEPAPVKPALGLVDRL